jgi:hypothetical protein
MLVMLPDAADGISALETDLTPKFRTLRAALRNGAAIEPVRVVISPCRNESKK